MWLLTVFEKTNVRIYEYQDKAEALVALKQFEHGALLTYMN
ncbi:hypothetical protein [Sporosarcina pasteurii]|uniref:Uncharacterized protein n=1 Tax=Sporosarcina pasteurii TaxID=1474 RepID=A0A380BXJ4_SPOPA|nr:hypothetical protein [Sporosarcina pasteurii]MDS9471421.1 hypothetical protein [Sporosarcina pasteurii]SUJ09115.1 Uncharacterised protein [Sporosarcina pasteurii]